ncbi:MAG: ADP-ribosylglycohydrolase family protein [Sulfurovum sp.]|nr:MAG: Uncharacterised protein [Arcobacter lacus]
MLGAIIGDICGSYYEDSPVEDYNFELLRDISNYTDDSILTIATVYSILNNESYTKIYKLLAKIDIHRGFGNNFINWVESDNNKPYYSYGNGSAMRVSPVGYIYNTVEETLIEAKKSAEVTHNHPEGIKGAEAIALCVFLARIGKTKEEIKKEILNRYKYDLNRTIKEIKPSYQFDVSCQGSVPEAIISFLESNDYESSVRNAIYLGGDSDTLACMSGSIAEAYYKEIPKPYFIKVLSIMPPNYAEIINQFYLKYGLETKFI